MHRKARRLVLSFLGLVAIPLLLGFVTFYAYDPLQIFHKPWSRPPTLHSNMRLQAAGIIRHYPFDRIIFGTSMTENTSADEASRLLGGHFINLSLTAGDFFERSLVLADLLRRRKVKEVIYTMDLVYINSRKGYPLFPIPTFEFLYDRNPFNDIRVYLNRHFAECLWRRSREEACIGRNVGLDRPNAWFAQEEYAMRFGGMEKWCMSKDNYQIKDAHELVRKAAEVVSSGGAMSPSEAEIRDKVRTAIRYIDENVVRHVRDHLEIRFVFFFPPYFRATYAIWSQAKPIQYAIHEAVVRYMVQLSGELQNMEVFGFEDAAFVDDLATYKDLGHYRESIDSVILESIAAKKHRLTAGNVAAYLEAARAKATSFDLIALNARLDACTARP